METVQSKLHLSVNKSKNTKILLSREVRSAKGQKGKSFGLLPTRVDTGSNMNQDFDCPMAKSIATHLFRRDGGW